MTSVQRYKYPLHLPASLKDMAMRLARQDGVSLNQWIVAAVAQKIGAVETAETFLQARGAGAGAGDLTRYLDKAPDIAPEPQDALHDDQAAVRDR